MNNDNQFSIFEFYRSSMRLIRHFYFIWLIQSSQIKFDFEMFVFRIIKLYLLFSLIFTWFRIEFRLTIYLFWIKFIAIVFLKQSRSSSLFYYFMFFSLKMNLMINYENLSRCFFSQFSSFSKKKINVWSFSSKLIKSDKKKWKFWVIWSLYNLVKSIFAN